MRPLPAGTCTALLRTDFSDDGVWQEILTAVGTPTAEGFLPDLTPIDDIAYLGATKADILDATGAGYRHPVVLVVDEVTVRHPEHAILVISLRRDRGREFRAIPEVAWSVENNLSQANMDFHEFVDAAHQDGVYRGF
ncbi:DUF6924 domain-containing protein [Kibdelosporangium persicum]|uniref:DUF6924 domain-containing protein n=1 Tax=Kibdelosporangium persicum TaxID=2698649 RepID=A0ABX2F111_9PSEU|nr:hypothetical protein [Kibdelosporangium persicum]NRN65014.1 hypothetical protein [Kibdelosporangium persicum]